MFYFALYALASKKLGPARLRGAIRVAAYTSAITLAGGAIGMHKARAALNDKGMEFGEDMASLSAMLHDAQTIHLNGQTIHTASAATPQGVHAVLDQYEGMCQAAMGGNAPVWDKLPEITNEPPKEKKMLTMAPILRNEEASKGMIVCFVPKADQSQDHSERALSAALQDFEQTGNVGAVGRLRYAFVRGGPTGSTVITVWTDDAFNIKALIPNGQNDTAGADPSIMQRPEGAQRLFEGTIDNMPYHVYGYKISGDPKKAIDAYDLQMQQAGWASVTNPIFEGMPHEGGEGRAYISDTKGFGGVVSVVRDPDGNTMVGIAEVTNGVVPHPTEQAKEADGF